MFFIKPDDAIGIIFQMHINEVLVYPGTVPIDLKSFRNHLLDQGQNAYHHIKSIPISENLITDVLWLEPNP